MWAAIPSLATMPFANIWKIITARIWRVKNRDATTPLGPWITDASDIADPQALGLRTLVNGQAVQQGSTSDMILSVAGLIAYLTETMTLMPGDMIMTGTPQGLHFCAVGDEVVCEIESLGRLVSHLVGEAAP